MGQQAAVGRAAEDGAGQQQRAVEPAAVLVVAFQVQVGLGAFVVVHAGVRAAQHVPEGAARVEPHFQNVQAFGVVRCVFGPQDVFGGDAAPGFDAALLNNAGRLVDDLHRARVQLARIDVQKERQRHAPAALARDAPVGPVGNHVAQAGLAVFGVKAGVFDSCQRNLAQRLCRFLCWIGEHAFALVHAHKPLRGGAVDHRRFVPPAVRVTVRDAGGAHQAASHLEGINDQRHSLPDGLAAKQRKVGRVLAIALHGVEDVVVRQPVAHAAVEVVHPVGRGAVHDTRAVFGGGVLGHVDGREAVVAGINVRQRMLEIQAIELLPHGSGHHLAADAPTLQAFFHQGAGQDEQAALGIDQAVFQRGVYVQRLVGRNRPCGGGPDHGKGGFVQRCQTEGCSQLLRRGCGEHHVQGLAGLVGIFDFKLGQ